MAAGLSALRPSGRRTDPVVLVLGGGFGLFGAIVGGQGVLWAELMHTLALGAGVFGSVQLLPPLVAIGLLLAGGPLSAWAGKKALTVASLLLLAASLLALGRADGLAGFAGALAIQGAGIGVLETALNGAVLDWERLTRRTALNAMHAVFSGGAVGGAFGAGALLAAGWTSAAVLGLLAGLTGALLAATLAVAFPPAESGRDGAGSVQALGLLRAPGLRRLALVGVLGILGESVANTWSVIRLRELGAAALVGGSAFALFNGAMAAGRLGNAALVARLGPRRSLLVSGAGLVGAGGLLIAPAGVGLSVSAFVLLGLAVAGIVPTMLSAAAEAAPGDSGAVSGAMLAVAYTGFVVCPPVIGWLAEALSLQAALATVSLAGLGVLALARHVRDA